MQLAGTSSVPAAVVAAPAASQLRSLSGDQDFTSAALCSLDLMNEDLGPRTSSATPSAEDVALSHWMDEQLVAALEGLPEHFRRAVLLCDVEGLSYAQAAGALGCALGTVMSRLHLQAFSLAGHERVDKLVRDAAPPEERL